MIVTEDIEFLAKVSEVVTHPLWQGLIDEETAVTLLRAQPSMTYLLRQGSEGEYDYWLSHKNRNGRIHHCYFTIKPFPDGWIFIDHGAPPHEDLSRFIQGALAYEN
jgi:hypothetical protein